MSGMIRVRKIRVDYAGADGMPKPMTLTMSAEAGFTADDYEQWARRIFHEQFPQWMVRNCSAADEDLEVEESSLRPVPGIPGAWGEA